MLPECMPSYAITYLRLTEEEAFGILNFSYGFVILYQEYYSDFFF